MIEWYIMVIYHGDISWWYIMVIYLMIDGISCDIMGYHEISARNHPTLGNIGKQLRLPQKDGEMWTECLRSMKSSNHALHWNSKKIMVPSLWFPWTDPIPTVLCKFVFVFFWEALVFLYTRQDGHDVRLAALKDAKAKEAGGACDAVALCFFDGGPQHQHGHVQWGIEWFWMVFGVPNFLNNPHCENSKMEKFDARSMVSLLVCILWRLERYTSCSFFFCRLIAPKNPKEGLREVGEYS